MSLLKPDETSPLERRSFIKLVVADPTQRKFLLGWVSRGLRVPE